MYVVHSRMKGNVWRQESRHRLFERAQDSARRLTSAKYALRNIRTCHHRDDVMILAQACHHRDDVMILDHRGGACYYLGPQSHEF